MIRLRPLSTERAPVCNEFCTKVKKKIDQTRWAMIRFRAASAPRGPHHGSQQEVHRGHEQWIEDHPELPDRRVVVLALEVGAGEVPDEAAAPPELGEVRPQRRHAGGGRLVDRRCSIGLRNRHGALNPNDPPGHSPTLLPARDRRTRPRSRATMGPLRILHLVTRSQRRGAELVAVELARGLDSLGHTNQVLALGLGFDGGEDVDLPPLTRRSDEGFRALWLGAGRCAAISRSSPSTS